MSKNKIPETIQQFWRDSPTKYTQNDIQHLEPASENAVFLKQLALLSGKTPDPPIETFYLKSLEGDFLISTDNSKLVYAH